MYLTSDSALEMKIISNALQCSNVKVVICCSFIGYFTSFLLAWRSVDNPRRSAHWRTRWQHWGKTMKGVLAPTPVRSGTFRRTWSPPNTSCCECRSSWQWQRRCVMAVSLLSEQWMFVGVCLLALTFFVFFLHFLQYAVYSGVGEKVPADCSLSKHERNPD